MATPAQRRICAALLVLAGLASGGCARDALVVQRGGELVAAGAPAMDASRQFLNRVMQTSERAGMELAVADRSCLWPDIRFPADDRQIADPRQGKAICSISDAERAARRAAAAGGSAFREPTPFRVLGAEDLKPTLLLIEGLVAYLEAIDEVVTAQPDGSVEALDSVLADAQNIVGIAAALGGAPEMQLLTAAQADAAKGLVGLIAELRQAESQAARLTAIEGRNPQTAKTVASLRTSLDLWSTIALESDLDTIDAAFGHRARRIRPEGTDADYRAFLAEWSSVRAQHQAAGTALPAQLGRMLDAVAAAHASYANIIEDQSLTPENRRAKARIARVQFSRALSSVAAVLRAFL